MAMVKSTLLVLYGHRFSVNITEILTLNIVSGALMKLMC